MKLTQELITEHNAVLLALQLLEKLESALTAKNKQAPEHLGQLLDFFKGFVDLCHHGKEENVLFPELKRRGVKREGGPIGVMLAEHDVGRGHVRGMLKGLYQLRYDEDEAVTAIREHACTYRNLLRVHIHKENNVLFPMADRLVPEDVAATIADKFREIERDRVGKGEHKAYHTMLHRLKEVYEVA